MRCLQLNLFSAFCNRRSLTSISLLGPPEIYKLPPSPAAAKSDPLQKFNSPPIPMGFTENGSPTFQSTGNPCLDFFFHVVPDTPPETLTQRLELAWKHDPLKALKLVCNLRGVRGKGKSDKEGGYTAALWLHQHHPKTLACNVASFAEFGYSKDLLEILFRVLEASDAREQGEEAYAQWKQRKAMRKLKKQRKEMPRVYNRMNSFYTPPVDTNHHLPKPKLSRGEKRIQRAKNVIRRFNSDPYFNFLHDRVSDYFAGCLRSDMKILLSSGDFFKISLAAKWCPTLDSSYDRVTLLCEAIARKVFPRDEYPEYQGMEEAHYAYHARARLRKEVLVPLRKALELPEVYMAAKDWGSIPYNRVASIAMRTYKDSFYRHDKERFDEYLEKVGKGEATIAAGALLPHEIIASLEKDRDGGEVAELQWTRMVDDMAKKGKLNNCLAISDVSESMSGTPMDVSVALGILVSELSEEPWKGKIITFSANPKLHTVQGSSLREKRKFVKNMEWGMNTDFQKVFDLLLEVAANAKLKPEEMIKTLFVFSDMEFDEANGTAASHCGYGYYGYYGYGYGYYGYGYGGRVPTARSWETDYQAIVRKFTERGYGDCVPEIVFWNLRDSKATPVLSKQSGVALVSGYSKNLMTLFLEGGGIIDPEIVMDVAISGEEYKKLVVLD